MRHRHPRFLIAIAILVAAPLVGPAATMQQAPKRPIEVEDVVAWKAIGATVLSSDGQWFGYRLAPQEGDAEIVLKRSRADKEWRFPAGEQPQAEGGGGGRGGAGAVSTLAFSEDGNWAAFTTYPTRQAAQRLKRQRRPIQSSVTLVNLATGEKKEYPKIRRFAFSGESSAWIALHRFGPDAPAGAGGAGGGAAAPAGGGRAGAGAGGAADRPRGTDLILRDLAAGAELNVGNVSEFSFRKDGRLLAFAIDAAEKAGNGLQIRDMTSGVVTPIDSGSASYERITWSDSGEALAVLKGTEDRAYRDKLYAVVGVTGVATSSPKKVTFDPAADSSVPKGFSISPEPFAAVDRGSASDRLRAPRAAGEGRLGGGRRGCRGRPGRRRDATGGRQGRRPGSGGQGGSRPLALQGSAAADAAGSAGSARSRLQLRRDLPCRAEASSSGWPTTRCGT